MKEKSRVIKRADVTDIIGLPIVVLDAAREFDEPEGKFIGVPREKELAAAAAIVRCQLAPSLTGVELKTIRTILDVTQAAMSEALGGGTAVVTISRWEGEDKGISDTAEKMLRILFCERLKALAPGVAYDPMTVLGLKIGARQKKMPPMVFRQEQRKVGRSIEATWVNVDAVASTKAAA